MTQKTMTIIIAVTLIVLIVFVYKYSVPPKGERIGPPIPVDTITTTQDTLHTKP